MDSGWLDGYMGLLMLDSRWMLDGWMMNGCIRSWNLGNNLT